MATRSAANRLALLARAAGLLDLGDVVERQGDLARGVAHVDLDLAELLRRSLRPLRQRGDVRTDGDHEAVHRVTDPILG